MLKVFFVSFLKYFFHNFAARTCWSPPRAQHHCSRSARASTTATRLARPWLYSPSSTDSTVSTMACGSAVARAGPENSGRKPPVGSSAYGNTSSSLVHSAAYWTIWSTRSTEDQRTMRKTHTQPSIRRATCQTIVIKSLPSSRCEMKSNGLELRTELDC